MFEKKVKETKDITKKKVKKAPEKKGILGIVLVPLLLTVVLVGAIYLLMGKLSEKEILLSDVVVAKNNLRVNAYITPEEVEQYFEVKQMDASLVTDATVTSLSDLKKRAFYVKVPVPAGKIMYVQDTVSTNTTLDKYLSGYEVTGISVSNFDRAVNGRIREGDVIDIYAVDKATDELTLYAEDVYVAAAYDSSGNELVTDEGVAVAFTIWVKEAEVEKVNQAINFGEIQLYRK